VEGEGGLAYERFLLVAERRILARVQDRLGLVQDASEGAAVSRGCEAGKDRLSEGQ
jgi:hypothetical protein